MLTNMSVKSLVFHLKEPLPPQVTWLLKENRLMVNETIRYGIENNKTSKLSLNKGVYFIHRKNHNIYANHIHGVCEISGNILKQYRKNLRKNKNQPIPYTKKLHMKIENKTYKFNIESNILDIPIRAKEHIQIELSISNYHKQQLQNIKLGSLTITPTKVIIAIKREVSTYTPTSILSLDTNERSLDGILATLSTTIPVTLPHPETVIIQETHYSRRKRIQKKKYNDRRILQKLTKREGTREHNRIDNRLHKIANTILTVAKQNQSVIVLENLVGLKPKFYSKQLNRRISAWSRTKLHNIIQYKAEWQGIPIIKVNPKNTSRTCPICGKIHKSRMDTMFTCECGWKCNKHINASINILQKATQQPELMARGIRFYPDAIQHDTVKNLYDLAIGASSESNELSNNVGGVLF
jgi:putative transposase